MTNPNPDDRPADGRYDDPILDPSFDIKAWIMRMDFAPPAEVARERAIRQWLEAAGFTEIDLRSLPERGEDCWQSIMRRGTNRDCTTGLAAQAMLHFLAADLGCRIDGMCCGLVWDDQIAVGFRLRPAA